MYRQPMHRMLSSFCNQRLARGPEVAHWVAYRQIIKRRMQYAKCPPPPLYSASSEYPLAPSLINALCPVLEGIIAFTEVSLHPEIGGGTLRSESLQSRVVATKGLAHEVRLDKLLSFVRAEVKLETLP